MPAVPLPPSGNSAVCPRRVVLSVEAHRLNQPRSLLRGLFTALPSCSVSRSDQSRALPLILGWPVVWEFRKGVLKRLLPPVVSWSLV